MIIYLIKSSLCLIILWGSYRWFLEKIHLHHFKRFYLLFCIIFSYTIPLITITYETEAASTTQETIQTLYHPISSTIYPKQETIWNYTTLWVVLYSIGLFVFATRFIKNLYHIIKTIKNHKTIPEISHTNVLIDKNIVPYTFLRYIFVSATEFRHKKIPKEVWLHEKTHVKQKHTLDILIVEFFQVIFWFNPIWFLVKKSIRLNHEFLADQKVLQYQKSIRHYITLLVNYTSSTHQTAFLTSSIHYSLTKKRIIMMSQQFSKSKTTARLFFMLPIIIGCVLAFNNDIVAQHTNTSVTPQSKPQNKTVSISVIKEKITVNNTLTSLADFATTIDKHTKDWRDEELKNANLNLSFQNTDSDFIQKLNTAYQKTRLYIANPSGRDLLPTKPLLPTLPKTTKETMVLKPSSQNITTKPNRKKKIIRSTPANVAIVPAPKPSIVPTPPTLQHHSTAKIAQNKIDDQEHERARRAIEVEHERYIQNLVEETEKARIAAIEKAHVALKLAEEKLAYAAKTKARAIENVYAKIEITEEQMQQHKEHIENIRQEAMQSRKEAVQIAQKARRDAREQVLLSSRIAQERAHLARMEAEKMREMSRRHVEKARKHAEKMRKKSIKESQKALKKMERAIENYSRNN